MRFLLNVHMVSNLPKSSHSSMDMNRETREEQLTYPYDNPNNPWQVSGNPRYSHLVAIWGISGSFVSSVCIPLHTGQVNWLVFRVVNDMWRECVPSWSSGKLPRSGLKVRLSAQINATPLAEGYVRSRFEIGSATAWGSETHGYVCLVGSGSIGGFHAMIWWTRWCMQMPMRNDCPEQTVQTNQTCALPPQSGTRASIGLFSASTSISKWRFTNRRVCLSTRTHGMMASVVDKTNNRLILWL